MWFAVAGATLSASAVAWAACVLLKSPAKKHDADTKTIWSEGRLILVCIVGLVAYYLFFFAMRSIGTQAFETAHRSIAFFFLHLVALSPLALLFVGGLIGVMTALEEAN
jgi:heme/copper-type cytochrome/quinol oxidase subunit 2